MKKINEKIIIEINNFRKLDLSPIRKLIIIIETIQMPTINLFELLFIKYPIKNKANPYTNAPTINSSLKKLATLPCNVVEKPKVL